MELEHFWGLFPSAHSSGFLVTDFQCWSHIRLMLLPYCSYFLLWSSSCQWLLFSYQFSHFHWTISKCWLYLCVWKYHFLCGFPLHLSFVGISLQGFWVCFSWEPKGFYASAQFLNQQLTISYHPGCIDLTSISTKSQVGIFFFLIIETMSPSKNLVNDKIFYLFPGLVGAYTSGVFLQFQLLLSCGIKNFLCFWVDVEI